jgi:hypothetical protein
VRAVDLRISGSDKEVVSVRIIQLHDAILAQGRPDTHLVCRLKRIVP